MSDIQKKFGGDKKVGKSLLSSLENRLKYWAVPKIPKSIETYHLTLTTLLWSVINVILGFYAKENLQILWLISLMILLQYLTDLFDGEVGRQRDTGLIKFSLSLRGGRITRSGYLAKITYMSSRGTL